MHRPFSRKTQDKGTAISVLIPMDFNDIPTEDGILNFFDSKVTNGIIEGLNSKIKTAMKRAYGFKSLVYLRTIIYLVAGKLALPTQY